MLLDRTGLSRASIGNRVVERINRPLQELLLAVEDDLLDSSSELVELKLFGDVEDDEDDVLAQFSSSTLPQESPASRTSPAVMGNCKLSD